MVQQAYVCGVSTRRVDQLVESAALKAAIAKVLGCAWQRCTVHFLRDCLGHARKDSSRR